MNKFTSLKYLNLDIYISLGSLACLSSSLKVKVVVYMLSKINFIAL